MSTEDLKEQPKQPEQSEPQNSGQRYESMVESLFFQETPKEDDKLE